MLNRLVATRFDRPASSGRTKPVFAAVTGSDGAEVEIVLKPSGRCDRGVNGLACEVLAACLAADLGLPVPEPFLVEVTPAWVSIITNEEARETLARSSPIAFGSRRVGRGFTTWSAGTRLSQSALSTAAAVFAFDAFTQNIDRRPENPNLLVRGDEIRIIDHELTFCHELALGWLPPWTLGGLQSFGRSGAHVLSTTVRRASPDWTPVRAAWANLADARLQAYRSALPLEWADASPLVEAACTLIAGVRDRIDDCLAELQRVLLL